MLEEKQTLWRESASLILVAPKNRAPELKDIGSHDYELLLIKRSERTSKANNQFVFPGGLLEHQADESMEWLEYFQEFGVQQKQLKQMVISTEQRPRILQAKGTGCYDRFFNRTHIWAREISLRITAIRETFEEVGILLCRTQTQLNDASLLHAPSSCYTDDFDKLHWQTLVHSEPRQFLQLCRHLNVIPDLWALSEWSVWASPAPVRKGYETAFFIAFVQQMPEVLVEPSEVEFCIWQTPSQLVRMYRSSDIWLMPPQLYEAARFLTVPMFQKLQEFVEFRRQGGKGCMSYVPVLYLCTDGMVSTVIGDSSYLTDAFNQRTIIQVDQSIADFRSKAKRLHRFENFGLPHAQLHVNFELPDGNLTPTCNWQQLHKL